MDQWVARLVDLAPYCFFAVTAAFISLPLCGTNRNLWSYTSFNDLQRLILAAVLIVLAATSATFALNRLEDLARTIPLLHLLLTISLMAALRAGARLRHNFITKPRTDFRRGDIELNERVLIVGDNGLAELFIRAAQELSQGTIHVVGVLTTSDRYKGRRLQNVEILGKAEELAGILRRLDVHGVDITRITVAAPASRLSPEAQSALQDVEDATGVVVDYLSERLGFTQMRAEEAQSRLQEHTGVHRFPSLSDVSLGSEVRRRYWATKRIFDFVASLVLLVLAMPLMLVVAAAVMVDVGTPILFWQDRCGQFGRRLRIYKFRTMRSAYDADGTRIEEARRTSCAGRLLRKTRLDELPQLFHIMLGEMSFVGPRPLLSSEQSSTFAGRLAVRPGLTGWAQVNGGRLISVADKTAMDLYYIRNASFRLDFVIALKTIRMVLRGDRREDSLVAAARQDVANWQTELKSAGFVEGPES